MSTNRRGKWGPKGTGPNGLPLCYCGCGREVAKPSRTKFEAACWDRWAANNDPATQRRLVEERDRGVCALCHVDTEQRRRLARETRALWTWLARKHADDLFWRGELPRLSWESSDGPRAWGVCSNWAHQWVNEDMDREFPGCESGHAWEADHIVPVIEGGGECDLTNLRTLCLPCHRKETAALAKRRAQRRQQAKAAMMPEFQLKLSA